MIQIRGRLFLLTYVSETARRGIPQTESYSFYEIHAHVLYPSD